MRKSESSLRLKPWILLGGNRSLGFLLPGFEFGEEFFDFLGLLGSKVVLFGEVVLEVVELSTVVFEVFDQFPIALPNHAAGCGAEVLGGRTVPGAISLEIGGEMPEERALGESFSFERGKDVESVERGVGFSIG